jgi:hypothetical protein
METIHLLGRVLPEPFSVTVSFQPTVKWEAEDIGMTFEFVCHIKNSTIDVECRLPKYRDEYFPMIYMRALDLCRAQVDLIAFKNGIGLTVLLDSFSNPAQVITPIVPKDDRLAAICSAFTLDQGFDEVCANVLQSIPVFMALRDLISSITVPHDSLVNCARAMDRLKHLVASPQANDKQAWAQLREALRLDEQYLKFITESSKNPRHGRPGHTPGSITTEVTRRAWTIMNRYLEYVKRGSNVLPEIEFPVLRN